MARYDVEIPNILKQYQCKILLNTNLVISLWSSSLREEVVARHWSIAIHCERSMGPFFVFVSFVSKQTRYDAKATVDNMF